MAYCVFRCDNMPGTDQRTMNASVRVVNGSGENISVENGTIVEIGALISGKHDLYSATLATATSDLKDCAVVVGDEIAYDNHVYRSLDEITNPAGANLLAYKFGQAGQFSVTKEGFVGGTAPSAVGGTVKLGANGKIEAGAGEQGDTVLGTVLAIETVGRYTYYAIDMR